MNFSFTHREVIRFFSGMVILLMLTGAHADEMLYSKYQQKKNELVAVNEELDRAKIGYQSAKIEQNTANSKLEALKSDVVAEKSKLDKLRDFEETNPEIDFTNKINDQRAIWKKANLEYLSNKDYVSSLNTRVNDYKTQYDVAFNKKNNLEFSLQRISDDLAGAQVNERLKQIQQSKRINIKTRETCSLSVTKDQCRDQARVKAERQAAEQGSLVVVESVTEINNFNLTKDEARSRVSARVSDIQIIKDSFDLTADKSGWQVDYEISALVTPVITQQMREELKQQAMASLDSGYVAPSAALPAATPAVDERERAFVQQKEQEAIARRQIENEAMARQKEAEELEVIKQQAARKAEQEAARQATVESKTSKRRVFGGW